MDILQAMLGIFFLVFFGWIAWESTLIVEHKKKMERKYGKENYHKGKFKKGD